MQQLLLIVIIVGGSHYNHYIYTKTIVNIINLLLILYDAGEVALQKVSVGGEHLDHGLGKPLHVSVPDGGVLTLQLLQHLEALRQLREDVHHRAREVAVLRVLPEPVLLVAGVGAVEELQRHIVILVEPLHHEGLEPLGILWDLVLVGRDLRHVGLVEPLDPEVAVEVGGGLAEAVLLVLLQRQLDVRGEQAPHRRRGQLQGERCHFLPRFSNSRKKGK